MRPFCAIPSARPLLPPTGNPPPLVTREPLVHCRHKSPAKNFVPGLPLFSLSPPRPLFFFPFFFLPRNPPTRPVPLFWRRPWTFTPVLRRAHATPLTSFPASFCPSPGFFVHQVPPPPRSFTTLDPPSLSLQTLSAPPVPPPP